MRMLAGLFLLFCLASCTEDFKYDRAEMLYNKVRPWNKPSGSNSDLHAALDQVNEILRANDTSLRALVLHATIELSLENGSTAIEDLTKAIRLKKNADLYLLRSMADYDDGQYASGVRDADSALVLHAGEHEGLAWYWRGMSHEKLNDRNAACEDFSKAKQCGTALADPKLRNNKCQ